MYLSNLANKIGYKKFKGVFDSGYQTIE